LCKRGKTPVLSLDEEARRVLDAIDVSTHAGLRDRALIALMVFSSRASVRRSPEESFVPPHFPAEITGWPHASTRSVV
jgi:hypothetical protein